MSAIVVALLLVFNETQRAFRAGLTQIDVLETGRISSDMMGRELEQMTPARLSYPAIVNNQFNYGNMVAANFYAGISSNFVSPLRMALPGTDYSVPGLHPLRTNIVQTFFFLSLVNQDWIGTGYKVVPDVAGSSVGTLYRYSTNIAHTAATNMLGLFLNAPLSSFNRVAEGIVHLRLRAFATNGYPINSYGFLSPPLNPPPGPNDYLRPRNVFWDWSQTNSIPYEGDCWFMSNAVPAYLELEMGVLEPKVLERSRGIVSASGTAQQNLYLSNHVGQVHVFRQRIPIRNVDFSAYH